MSDTNHVVQVNPVSTSDPIILVRSDEFAMAWAKLSLRVDECADSISYIFEEMQSIRKTLLELTDKEAKNG
jgi:hypothetical protein